MNDRNRDRNLPEERRAVRLAVRRLAEEAPDLVAASADATRAGPAARADTLREAALAAWRAGIPPQVMAEDSQPPSVIVLRWVDADG